ncbi:MAG: hypothetical protein ACK52I_34370 [Pseudomonadota bacterium]
MILRGRAGNNGARREYGSERGRRAGFGAARLRRAGYTTRSSIRYGSAGGY